MAAVLFLVCYLVANTPFTKLLLFGYYQHLIEDHAVCRFIVEGTCDGDTVQDRYYCLLHSTLERKQGAESLVVIQSTETAETTALLSPSASSVDLTAVNVHTRNSWHCLKVQREYFQSDCRTKWQMINAMNPMRKRQIATCWGLGIYALFSLIALVYPVVWFGYVWVYLVIVEGTDAVVVEGEAQFIYYWIMSVVYTAMFVLCAMTIGVSAGKDIWTRISAAVFVWNFDTLTAADVCASKEILRTLPAVATVLGSQSLDRNVAISYEWNGFG